MARNVSAALPILFVVAGCGTQSAPTNQSDAATPAPGNDRIAKMMARLRAYPKPPAAEVDEIERKVSGPCIGRVADWERLYSFGIGTAPPRDKDVHPEVTIDNTVIQFKYRKIQPYVRRVDIPGSTTGIDDTPVKLVAGTYDRKTHAIRIDFCGDNAPPP